jgi:hypothetical protein
MPTPRSLLSPEYPVIYDVAPADVSRDGGNAAPWEVGGTVYLSLALLVRGIPSFLATIPVDRELVEGIRASLDAGDVQVAVAGLAVDAGELEAGAGEGPRDEDHSTGAAGKDDDRDAWKASVGSPDPEAFRTLTPLDDPSARGGSPETEGDGAGRLPAAYLSLVCQDGRRLGVARIVSRDRRATPEEVARYVLRQISSGVQIGNLASAG